MSHQLARQRASKSPGRVGGRFLYISITIEGGGHLYKSLYTYIAIRHESVWKGQISLLYILTEGLVRQRIYKKGVWGFATGDRGEEVSI
jgi:hypothetical protein